MLFRQALICMEESQNWQCEILIKFDRLLEVRADEVLIQEKAPAQVVLFLPRQPHGEPL
jgi:hypothetical protein